MLLCNFKYMHGVTHDARALYRQQAHWCTASVVPHSGIHELYPLLLTHAQEQAHQPFDN